MIDTLIACLEWLACFAVYCGFIWVLGMMAGINADKEEQ